MSDELDVLRDVVNRLDRAGIPYMVSGLDVTYIDKWAATLGVADLLAKVRP